MATHAPPPLVARRERADLQRVHLGRHQIAERSVDQPLPLHAVEAGELRALDGQREVALAAARVTGVADVLVAVVLQFEPARLEIGLEAAQQFGRDGTGGSIVMALDIERARCPMRAELGWRRRFAVLASPT